MHYSNTISKSKCQNQSRNKNNHFSVSQTLICTAITLYALLCFLSIALVAIVAFSSENSINTKGFSFFPIEWSLEAFHYVSAFKGQLIQSYAVTIYETVAGTVLSLFLTSMIAYVLSRKDFMLNKAISIYLLITMLFSGGLLGAYIINTNVFNLRNNLLVLILPGAVTAWNTIVMRTFIQSNVPDAIIDAAEIDGAGEIYTFFVVVFPILKPVIAALGFMMAIHHWNEWQTAFLYIDNPNLATLQLMLIRIEKSLAFLQERMDFLTADELRLMQNSPTESARMVILLLTIGPVMFIYPFFQKQFIKGITVGSVKG